MPSRRTKACRFSDGVKQAIYERDKGLCILCGKPGDPVAHYIARSQNGLGIEENGLTLCQRCHALYDNSAYRHTIKARLSLYLQSKYEAWDESKLIYRKYDI